MKKNYEHKESRGIKMSCLLNLDKLIELAEKQYSKKKFIHATRVATYAMEKAMMRKDVDPIEAYAVGIAHDLLEDTKCTQSDLFAIMDKKLVYDVVRLTKAEETPYEEYLESIIEYGSPLAILVKSEDMKDHMMQTETLTNK